jgi:hypothetical protein
MTHPLVQQLRFTRSEFKRALKGVSDEDACRRFLPMNCMSWNVGHLAWQEQKYFLVYGQGGDYLLPAIEKGFTNGAPASTPLLSEMMTAWDAITRAADPWLDTLTDDMLGQAYIKKDGKPAERIIGSLMQRVIYHYWYHIGENMAIRQMLGHDRLPQFVGSIDEKAPFIPVA